MLSKEELILLEIGPIECVVSKRDEYIELFGNLGGTLYKNILAMEISKLQAILNRRGYDK